MNIEEIKRYYDVRFDGDLATKFEVSKTTIYRWRKQGIPLLRQQAIQLETNNKLIARIEDVNLNGDEKR